MHTPADLQALALDRGGTLLAGGEHDGRVRLWDTVTGRPVGAALRTGSAWAIGVVAVAFSPDDRLLVAGTGDGKVWVWSLATGRPVEVAHLQVTSGVRFGATGLAFSPDGRLLAVAGTDGTVPLVDLTTGHLIGAPLPTGTQYGVVAVAFSPDGRQLASSNVDGKVQLWRPAALTHPYAALCADVGAPTRQEWNVYASGEPQRKVCR
jgi:WD40 repeat protein